MIVVVSLSIKILWRLQEQLYTHFTYIPSGYHARIKAFMISSIFLLAYSRKGLDYKLILQINNLNHSLQERNIISIIISVSEPQKVPSVSEYDRVFTFPPSTTESDPKKSRTSEDTDEPNGESQYKDP